MIFVALGTQKFQLNRLLKELDFLVEKHMISEKVFAQIGHSDYHPAHYEFSEFLDKTNFEKKIEECDVLITHGGVGTIVYGITHDKPVIVYPRLEKFKEHVDDHQLEIAHSFSEENLVLLCEEDDSLNDLIQLSKKHKFAKYVSNRKQLISIIEDYLDK